MVKKIHKNTKKSKKNKKTRKNLGKGPSLLSIRLPPLTNQQNSILLENPIKNSNSKIILTPLQTYPNTNTIYTENPIKNNEITKSFIDSVTELVSQFPVSSAKNKSRKNVRINSNDNEIFEIDIDSYEKSQKRFPREISIPTCKKRTLKFPCRKKNTVFIDRKDYDRYLELKSHKNNSIGSLSKSDHYYKIRRELESQGISLKSKKKG